MVVPMPWRKDRRAPVPRGANRDSVPRGDPVHDLPRAVIVHSQDPVGVSNKRWKKTMIPCDSRPRPGVAAHSVGHDRDVSRLLEALRKLAGGEARRERFRESPQPRQVEVILVSDRTFPRSESPEESTRTAATKVRMRPSCGRGPSRAEAEARCRGRKDRTCDQTITTGWPPRKRVLRLQRMRVDLRRAASRGARGPFARLGADPESARS